jgi:hypothetical protein
MTGAVGLAASNEGIDECPADVLTTCDLAIEYLNISD